MESRSVIEVDGTFQLLVSEADLQYAQTKVKPMMIVGTNEYILSVLGPYLADGKNSDANITKHMTATNAEGMVGWLQQDDVVVVDRGFRGSVDVLSDLGMIQNTTVGNTFYSSMWDLMVATQSLFNSHFLVFPKIDMGLVSAGQAKHIYFEPSGCHSLQFKSLAVCFATLHAIETVLHSVSRVIHWHFTGRRRVSPVIHMAVN